MRRLWLAVRHAALAKRTEIDRQRLDPPPVHLPHGNDSADGDHAVADAWEAAFTADRPVVLDVYTDANVPPLPPHISFDEAKGFLATLVKGDPAESAVIRNSLRAVGAQLFANAKSLVSRDKS